ncbi:DUF2842 domain-containing protein [Paracoccus tegillarcae]|uniref:DUF2842 domain-containing protein n=1 Tax=Paracoccus tegillarcae TaxID=1529068 RepID=A0A2K9EYJ1_9RHOB|nr:DUF2842 domain-containing protein [Paracoccus tegillarcae]AUH34384.1 DUF2842 domain-containing protein [Paracoccus tegillarcae]
MDLKTRKRLSILVLLIGLPGYIIIAWMLLGWLSDTYGRLSWWTELLVVIGLGVIWILPLKRLFSGVGKD